MKKANDLMDDLESIMGSIVVLPAHLKWTCSCSPGVLVPVGTDTKQRRDVFRAFVKAHSRKGCSVGTAGQK